MSSGKLNMFDERLVYAVQLPAGGTRSISREELERLSLNMPNPIPEMNGYKTWVSNYVGTFWSHLMGPVAFSIYFQLSKMAYGDKDHAYPSVPYLSELIGVSVPTIQKHMKTLIDLNFVIVLEVKDGRTNEHLPNLYMLSNTVPFISIVQYKQLPARLKKEHDIFMDKLKYRNVLQEGSFPKY